jgi:hypothetical protein
MQRQPRRSAGADFPTGFFMEVELDISTAGGDDLVDVRINGPSANIPNNPCGIVDIDTGEGRDNVSVDISGSLAELMIGLFTGDGADAVAVRLGDVTTGEADIFADLAAGNDSFRIDSAGWAVSAAGKASSGSPNSAAQAAPPPSLRVLGGAGLDQIIARQGQVSGNLLVDFDGQGGNDLVAADLVFAQVGLVTIDIKLSGGANNDLMSLLALGSSDPKRTHFLIDGDLGFDVGVGTTNVDIQHCEVVIGGRRRK